MKQPQHLNLSHEAGLNFNVSSGVDLCKAKGAVNLEVMRTGIQPTGTLGLWTSPERSFALQWQ